MNKSDNKYNAVMIPIKQILRDDDFNCRGAIHADSIYTLAEDIKKHGLDTPITVCTLKNNSEYKYKIITGHRRYTACRSIGMTEIPAFIRDDLDATQQAVLNFRENLERKELNILQEANGIQNIAALGYPAKEIGKMIGQSTYWTNVRIDLLILPEKVQLDAAAGLILPKEIGFLADLHRAGRSEDDILKFAAVARDKRTKENAISKRLLSESKRTVDAPLTKLRPKDEVENMMNTCLEVLRGASLASWALGWSLGAVTSKMFLEQIGREASLYGYNFVVPQIYISGEKAEKEKYGIVD